MPQLPEYSYPKVVAKIGKIAPKTAQETISLLNSKNIPNPVLPPKIIVSEKIETIVDSFDANTKEVFDRHLKLAAAVQIGDKTEVSKILSEMKIAGEIDDIKETEINGSIGVETDDPNWPTHISWSESVFGRQLTDDEIKKAFDIFSKENPIGPEIVDGK